MPKTRSVLAAPGGESGGTKVLCSSGLDLGFGVCSDVARSHKDGTWYMNFDDFCEHFFCAYFGLLFPAATHSLYHVATWTGTSKHCRRTVSLQLALLALSI